MCQEHRQFQGGKLRGQLGERAGRDIETVDVASSTHGSDPVRGNDDGDARVTQERAHGRFKWRAAGPACTEVGGHCHHSVLGDVTRDFRAHVAADRDDLVELAQRPPSSTRPQAPP